MRDRVSPPSSRGTSVKEDWRARLPGERSKVFCAYVHALDSTYGMLSVSLNEALELRAEGRLAKSCQAVGVTPELCTRLTVPLAALIRILAEHARHYGTVPNTAPLDPTNFQSSKRQRSARINGLVSHVLLSQRTQFLYKLGALQEMVEDLGKDFCASAQDLKEGLSTDPTVSWKIVDAAHYDLNTCLRETIVLLKSFLRALPEDQVAGFQKSVAESWAAATSETNSDGSTLLRHRRMAHIAGE